MKKITWLVLVIFLVIVAGLIGVGFGVNLNPTSISLNNPPVNNSVVNQPTKPVNSPVNKPVAAVNTPTNKPAPVVNTPVNKPNPVVNTPAPAAGLTAAQVSAHNSPNDCYLIVNSKVYNVTTYIGNHPGGKQKIYDYCGGESSAVFAAIHSNFAWNLLTKYFVADLIK